MGMCVSIHTHTLTYTNQFIPPNSSEGLLEMAYSGSGKSDQISLNLCFHFVYHDLNGDKNPLLRSRTGILNDQ